MVRPRHVVTALTCFLALTGCKTSTATSADAAQNDGRSMLWDDKPLTAQWRSWTPSDAPSTPPALADGATAFDFWQVTDEPFREDAWAALFGVLTEARTIAPDDAADTFRMLMTVLEPENPEGIAHLDATFFAARPGQPMFEGVAWRMWRELPSGATPGVTVWLRRASGGAELPTEATLWLYGGFEETRSLTLRVSADAWLAADGIVTHATTAVEGGEPRLMHDILQMRFWKPVVGSAYLDTAIRRRESPTQTPPQQPVALGLALGDRDIEQVFSDSVFAPRFTLFPTKQP